MARLFGCRSFGSLYAAVILSILYQPVKFAIVPTGGCNTRELSNDLNFFGLRQEGNRVALVYIEGARQFKVLLESMKHTQYRMFMLDDTRVLVVRCKQGMKGAFDCGLFVFEKNKITTTTNTGYNSKGWAFKPFYGAEDLESGFDMNRIFVVSKETRRNKFVFTLYVNYEWKAVFSDEPTGELKKTNIALEGQTLAGCFDTNIQCHYDYYTERVAQFRNDLSTVLMYGRLRFFTDGNNFFVDKFNEFICYEKRNNYFAIAPYFNPKTTINDAPLVTQFLDLFSNSDCPSDEEFEEVDKHKKYYNDDEYDEETLKHTIIFQTHKCPPGGRALLAVFIVAIIIDVILTLLLIAMIIATLIARHKMKTMGKKMPKKPWETQATEDCTTFMDQTVGVTEATTGGETTGYTTVAQ